MSSETNEPRSAHEPYVIIVLVITAFVIGVIFGLFVSQDANESKQAPPSRTVIGIPEPSKTSTSISDPLIEAANGDFKRKLEYMKEHKPGVYDDILRDWRSDQDMNMHDPFESADAIERRWNRCYSNSFGGSWQC